jgi:hypothetical protein
VEDFVPRLADFLGRYWLFLLLVVASLFFNFRKLSKYRNRKREIFDRELTPEWSNWRQTFVREGTLGQWQGREVRLRRLNGLEGFDTLELSVESAVSGSFVIEKGGLGLLKRAVRFGAPPAITPLDPADQQELRVLSEGRSLPDRLLSDLAVRGALRENLRDVRDELSLRRGRLRVVRRVRVKDPAAPAVRDAWKLLREAARVVGLG